jgi:hypothetical protein
MAWKKAKTPDGPDALFCFHCGGKFHKLETVLHNPKTKKLKHFEPCRKLPTAVSQYMAEIGRRGGASKSEAKKRATRESLAHARAVKLGRLRDGHA